MKTIEWGWLIVSYLFLGGLSAGLFFASGLAALLPKGAAGGTERVARYGAWLAPWPVLLGCMLLIFDLGRWHRFYKLFLHFEWTSPMSIGAWLLLAFSLIALLYAYAWLPAGRRERLFATLPTRLAFLRRANRDVSAWQRPLALLGLPAAVGVGIYTGVLLGAVQSRPFWNTNLVAQLFLFSALSSGCGALLLALILTKKTPVAAELRLLYTLDLCFLALEFFVVVPYVIHGQLSVQAVRESLALILGGPFTLPFWVFFVGLGLLLPLGIEIRETIPAMLFHSEFHYRGWLAAGTAALVLTGGFLLRYIFVFAGQMSAFK